MSLRFVPSPLPGDDPGDPAAAARSQASRRVPAPAAEALLAHGPAHEARARLLAGGTLAVTTGQQPGLFTGPLYAIYKALSAAAFARELERRLGTAVVPVFWVAGDDHDFHEVNHCTVVGADGKPARVVLRERSPDAPMLPAYREPVWPEGGAALARLEAALPPSEFRADTVDWLARSYAPERSLAEACAVALAELLGPFGVVVCRGWDRSLKAAGRELLLRAAREAEGLDRGLVAETRRLLAGGRETPVEVGRGLTLLMLEGSQGRDRLRALGDGRFATRRGGEELTLAVLERIAADEPERLSANVLLRPALEAQLFPTVVYVAGPGELAYLAQARPVFEALGVPRPARLPRVSGFLVESKVDKVLERFALTPDDLAAGDGELARRVAREDLPPGAASALETLRAAIADGYGTLKVQAGGVDRTLEKPVESARNQALVGLVEIEKKLVAALRRASDTALQQVARAREQLFPGGAPQERVVSVVSFLSRHGRAVLEVLDEAAREHARRLLDAPPGRS